MDLKYALERCSREMKEGCLYYSSHAWILLCFAAEHIIMLTRRGGVLNGHPAAYVAQKRPLSLK